MHQKRARTAQDRQAQQDWVVHQSESCATARTLRGCHGCRALRTNANHPRPPSHARRDARFPVMEFRHQTCRLPEARLTPPPHVRPLQAERSLYDELRADDLGFPPGNRRRHDQGEGQMCEESYRSYCLLARHPLRRSAVFSGNRGIPFLHRPHPLSFICGRAASAAWLSAFRSFISSSTNAMSARNSVGSGTATVSAAGLSWLWVFALVMPW